MLATEETLLVGGAALDAEHHGAERLCLLNDVQSLLWRVQASNVLRGSLLAAHPGKGALDGAPPSVRPAAKVVEVPPLLHALELRLEQALEHGTVLLVHNHREAISLVLDREAVALEDGVVVAERGRARGGVDEHLLLIRSGLPVHRLTAALHDRLDGCRPHHQLVLAQALHGLRPGLMPASQLRGHAQVLHTPRPGLLLCNLRNLRHPRVVILLPGFVHELHRHQPGHLPEAVPQLVPELLHAVLRNISCHSDLVHDTVLLWLRFRLCRHVHQHLLFCIDVMLQNEVDEYPAEAELARAVALQSKLAVLPQQPEQPIEGPVRVRCELAVSMLSEHNLQVLHLPDGGKLHPVLV
mmetsp:Transcript_94459/g.299802  ORF Transcript_94459/g.299802 Transcript_94459/m.299802 type:complete len:354 (-) Transcript_94459:120-1181(-)